MTPCLDEIWARLDPRLVEGLRADWTHARKRALRLDRKVALVGHRGAGKSALLEPLSALTGLRGFDLDREIERSAGRAIREWYAHDPKGFRAAEREAFGRLPEPCLVAVGGGFLSHHAELLEGHLAVLVPVSFETYRERLLADTTRPRLRPELTLEEEIAQVYAERERLHAKVSTLPLAEFLASVAGGG